MIVWFVVLALVIAAALWFVRSASRSGQQPPGGGRRSPGLDALDERYARGEINRDEYLEKKRGMTG